MTTNTILDVGNEESQEINVVELIASENSKITNISLYSGRAEITRLFEVAIKAGQNKVTIIGLPGAFQEDSLRVEGHGNASIHDVIVERVVNYPSARVTGNEKESALRRERRVIEKALESAEKSRATLNGYLNTITANDFDIPRLEATLEGYTALSQKVDKQILDLEKDLAEVAAQIRLEKYANQAASARTESWKTSIDVHGQVEEEIELRIKYAVYQADWTPSYDIRVDTKAKEKAVTIMYKASITQNTGESWDNAPLTLETVTPSFGITPPVLHPWRVSTYQQPRVMPGIPMTGMSGIPMGMTMMPSPTIIRQPSYRSRSRSHSRSRSRSPRRGRSHSPDSPVFANYSSAPLILPSITQPIMVPTSSKGSVAATFRIPGLVNIPSDGGKHNVTVAQLILDATLLWYTIPASDARVHLKAKIQNNSEYMFVPGNANIYVDGSFIATTHIPSASPQEIFDCPLGLDTSIRVTYHPREKKLAKSGFYSKSLNQSFTQRITIFNTKSITIQNLKVIDRVPVSEDEKIEVKVLNPALSTTSTNNAPAKNSVQVANNVIAQWDGIEEPGVDSNAIGKDGKLNWIVSIPPQKSVSLVLQFEVNYPENLAIVGL
ncbi:hypothetical protein CVT25_012811 [Psilocybe cyanescens]|uniref:DUF4139 domain-containing protein n=1 Tax=Psilocybe cyanescens TaxID=93625 RepID=A0A409XF82_PSICY|nr:hypothetical protein CVT25_012811 [Psilocybe cyanescens]